MRVLLVITGILLGAIGGVIAYRAAFVEPSAGVLITGTEVRQVPNTMRIASGIVLLIVGAVMAFLAASRCSRKGD